MTEQIEDLKKDFYKDMQNLGYKSKTEIGYSSSRYYQMLGEYGGYETARRLINKSGTSEGFVRLWMNNRLDLSVEALVLNPKYAPLFTPEELEMCRNTLEKYKSLSE